jgi:hypothetical protein
MKEESPIQKTERLLKLTDKLLNRNQEPIEITATELLNLDKSKIMFTHQTEADEFGDYVVYYSINSTKYAVKTNLFNL